MVYWITFHILVIVLLLAYSIGNKDIKRVITMAICIVLIIFAGYRDGLGADYMQYTVRLENYSYGSLTPYLEPLFTAISILIRNTNLSVVFFFVFCACITNLCIVKFCQSEKSFFPWMIALYVFIPTMYGQTFNLVRQYFGIGLFYYSLRFIGNSFVKYAICVLVAATMHFSAIFLLPLYFFLGRRFKLVIYLGIFVAFLAFISSLNIIAGNSLEKYEIYSTSTNTMYMSGFLIIYNLLCVAVLLNKRMMKMTNPIYSNLLFLLAVFVDMSYVNYFYYRFAIYFLPIVVYVIPYLVYNSKYIKGGLRPFTMTLIVAFLIVIMYNNLLSNVMDIIIVPRGILPLSSIFDR